MVLTTTATAALLFSRHAPSGVATLASQATAAAACCSCSAWLSTSSAAAVPVHAGWHHQQQQQGGSSSSGVTHSATAAAARRLRQHNRHQPQLSLSLLAVGQAGLHTSSASLGRREAGAKGSSISSSSSSGGDAAEGLAPPPSGGRRPPPQQRRNHQITAQQLLVIFPDGTKQELRLAAARSAAAELQLDLVEVNPRSSPPIAKIVDWGKQRYEQQQKAEAVEKAKRLTAKLNTPKEMQFTARIADHDLEVKLRRVQGWLEEGYRVQLVVKHGREEDAAAAEALDYLATRLAADFKLELGAPQQQRRALAQLVKPLGPLVQQQPGQDEA